MWTKILEILNLTARPMSSMLILHASIISCDAASIHRWVAFRSFGNEEVLLPLVHLSVTLSEKYNRGDVMYFKNRDAQEHNCLAHTVCLL